LHRERGGGGGSVNGAILENQKGSGCPANKVTFVLFSMYLQKIKLYNFIKKSITDHHIRPETEQELCYCWFGVGFSVMLVVANPESPA